MSAFRRARRTAARTPVIQRRPPTARCAEVIATAFPVQTDVAPSVTCAATRTNQSVEREPKAEMLRTFRSERPAATTRATTTQANVRWVKWARTPVAAQSVPVGTTLPKERGQSGMASPAPVWRTIAPRRIWM